MTAVNWTKITEDMHVACLHRHVSLRDVASEIGISPSGLTRLRQGQHLSADGLAALAHWLYPDNVPAWFTTGQDPRIDMEAK